MRKILIAAAISMGLASNTSAQGGCQSLLTVILWDYTASGWQVVPVVDSTVPFTQADSRAQQIIDNGFQRYPGAGSGSYFSPQVIIRVDRVTFCP